MESMKNLVFFLLVMPMIILLAGCTGSIPIDTGESTGLPGIEGDSLTPSPLPGGELGEATPDQENTLPDETLPPSAEPSENPNEDPVVGEVQDSLLEEIIADLIGRTNSDRGSIQVIQAQAVIWSDGSLGCPQPGMFYTQSLIEGYRVLLKIGENEYDYHASESGNFLLCEGQGDSPSSHPDKPGLRTVP